MTTAQTSQLESSTQLIDAPVVRVVLLEDRAQVIRRVELSLSPGSQTLRIADVAPLAADRTLTARVSDGLRLDEARVRRKWRIGVEERPPAAAEIEREIRRLQRAIEDAEEKLQGRQQHRARLQTAMERYVENINRVMPFTPEFDGGWESDLDGFCRGLRSVDGSLLDGEEARADLQRELDAVELHHHIGNRPDHYLAAELLIDVTSRDGGECQVEVEYTVPCALWRPIHRATLREGSVLFECEAAVWQSTGEDWTDVELQFSTARPTQQSEPPVLHDDLLQVRRKPEKKVSVEVREQVIATTGEGRAEEADGLPGVDDGGETRLLDAAVTTTVRADGRMRRIPLHTFDADAEQDRICCPEVAAGVHLRSRQANASAHPILAGPVDLLRNGGYVGRSQVGFVAPGELFALGWGSEDGLRVRREPHSKRETSKITRRTTLTHRIEVFLSNLDDRRTTFTVKERIPVSEIDKVRIELDEKETYPLVPADDDGIFAWEITLPAHGTEKLQLVYALIASSDVQGI